MLKIDDMQIDDTFKVYAEAVLEQEIAEVKAIVADERSAATQQSMSPDEFRKILSQHTEAVKQAYKRVHANYHLTFNDDRCPEADLVGECLFCVAERRFTEILTEIIASAGNDRNAMTADEIEALARKQGVPYLH